MTDQSRYAPWKPVGYDLPDIVALQALQQGTADAEQQKRALKWIVEVASGRDEQSFYPGGEDGRRNTDFAEGRRFVGNSIVKMLRLNPMHFRRKDNENS